jgi:hypothetical protein
METFTGRTSVMCERRIAIFLVDSNVTKAIRVLQGRQLGLGQIKARYLRENMNTFQEHSDDGGASAGAKRAPARHARSAEEACSPAKTSVRTGGFVTTGSRRNRPAQRLQAGCKSATLRRQGNAGYFRASTGSIPRRLYAATSSSRLVFRSWQPVSIPAFQICERKYSSPYLLNISLPLLGAVFV